MRVGELLGLIAAALRPWDKNCSKAIISRQTGRRSRWICRCMMQTTKPTLAIQSPGGPDKGILQSDGYGGLTIMSAEPESSMQRAGRMPSESSSTRSKSIPKIRARSGSWHRWMNFCYRWPSTGRFNPSCREVIIRVLAPRKRHRKIESE